MLENDPHPLPARATHVLCAAGGTALFTDNETNAPRVFGPGSGQAGRRIVKDAFHRHVVNGEDATNPRRDRHEGRRSLSSLTTSLPVRVGRSCAIGCPIVPTSIDRSSTSIDVIALAAR